MSSPVRDETLTLNGTRLHYLEGGDPAAPPLLMVHGLTREAHSFDPVLDLLAGRYRCLAVDVRGRGGSTWTAPETYSTLQYADDVRAFLDALELDAVHYLGTSMGGIIALAVAERDPQRFLSLALNDIGPETAVAGSERIQAHLARIPARFASWDEAIAHETGRYPWLATLPRERVEAQYRHMLVPNGDGSWRFHYDPNIRLGRAVTPEGRDAQRERSWRGFRALTCPLLLIRGAETDLLAAETVAAMQAVQPGLTVAEVPGVGHAPSLAEPEAQAALAAFFTGA